MIGLMFLFFLFLAPVRQIFYSYKPVHPAHEVYKRVFLVALTTTSPGWLLFILHLMNPRPEDKSPYAALNEVTFPSLIIGFIIILLAASILEIIISEKK